MTLCQTPSNKLEWNVKVRRNLLSCGLVTEICTCFKPASDKNTTIAIIYHKVQIFLNIFTLDFVVDIWFWYLPSTTKFVILQDGCIKIYCKRGQHLQIQCYFFLNVDFESTCGKLHKAQGCAANWPNVQPVCLRYVTKFNSLPSLTACLFLFAKMGPIGQLVPFLSIFGL